MAAADCVNCSAAAPLELEACTPSSARGRLTAVSHQRVGREEADLRRVLRGKGDLQPGTPLRFNESIEGTTLGVQKSFDLSNKHNGGVLSVRNSWNHRLNTI